MICLRWTDGFRTVSFADSLIGKRLSGEAGKVQPHYRPQLRAAPSTWYQAIQGAHMLSLSGHLAIAARFAVIAFAACVIATPATAQFGGLKKKIKATAKQETAAPPANEGGMVVLTPDVVNQLLAGLEASQAERDAATKADTPYGRYKKGQAAYDVAKPKCDAAQPAFYQRAARSQKLIDKYDALNAKMIAAQSKGDMKRQAIYQDSAMALIDPSCVVKKPDEPKDYYQAEREAEGRAHAKETEASGFSGNEMAMLKERAIAILTNGTPPGGASAGEKSAVAAKSAQLKPLLGIREAPVQAAKPVPKQPADVPSSPAMPPGAANMSDCMMKNIEKHEAKIEALGKRAEAAQEAGNQQKLMAIADTINRLQMDGCR
jgi:hypothetical protein